MNRISAVAWILGGVSATTVASCASKSGDPQPMGLGGSAGTSGSAPSGAGGVGGRPAGGSGGVTAVTGDQGGGGAAGSGGGAGAGMDATAEAQSMMEDTGRRTSDASADGTIGLAPRDAASSPPAGPYPSPACLGRANALIAQMTPTEKYAQMMQPERAQVTPQLMTQYDFGSVYSQGGSGPATNSATGWADMADGYRQAALASRLKIPTIYGADEVHGIGTVRGATIFPHNIGLGATRDPELVRRAGAITALEALGTGVDFVFSPVVAVALNERWGRTYEAFGETTDLASTMGSALLNGLQLTATGGPTGILGNPKHYLGDGGTTNGANGGLVAGDEATLRAIHLEPYRAAVAARAGAIMASYNSWQGVKMHVNKAMLTDVLKGELGFGGFVNSDFDACAQLPGTDYPTGLGQCINAGVDMFMSFRATPAVMLGYFAALAAAGTITPARIDDAVRRIVAVKCEMGLFAGTGRVDRALTMEVGSAAHRMVARESVQKSLVVLKNDANLLPLAKTGPVALAGKSADNAGNQAGGWTISWQGASGNDVTGATNVRQALEGVLGAPAVLYSLTGTSFQGATTGIAVIGETPYAEGMGDRASLALDAADVAAVRALKTAGLKTVVVLIAGRPMLLDTILPYADAIVFAGLPGSEGGGITDVLFGDARPSGKLPHTWPMTMAQVPINFGDASYAPQYPYGFGLTY